MTTPGSGDVVLRRADGFIAYQLATVIDELSLGTTDVVRGADLWEALPAQHSLFAALGERPPRFRMGRCCVIPRARSSPSVWPARNWIRCVLQGWMQLR